MTETRFEWDERKNEANRKKHGIDFETAMRVFADPFALSEQDRIEDGEERWQTIGLVGGYLVLLVAHTVREDDEIATDENGASTEVIRIISARKADRKERRRYETESR